jgi:hypothetical protein
MGGIIPSRPTTTTVAIHVPSPDLPVDSAQWGTLKGEASGGVVDSEAKAPSLARAA